MCCQADHASDRDTELSRNRISTVQVEFPKIVFLGIVVRYPRVYPAQFGLTQCDLNQFRLDDLLDIGSI